MKSLTDYLKENHTQRSAKRYLFSIEKYLETVGESAAQKADYAFVVNYIGKLREQYNNVETIRCGLYGIRKYYAYLQEIGVRIDHPCKDLKLKDYGKQVQLQDLFSRSELEELLDRKERYPLLANRNKVLISLLIYQGLTAGELIRLEEKDVRIEEATIYIKASQRLNRRTLPLKENQIDWMKAYQTDRLKLLGENKSGAYLITHRGTAENGEGIGYLLETFRKRFPNRKLNAKTIKQSVIASLLKAGKDLRTVQVFAGHKYSSSTERYQQTQDEQLKQAVLIHHPLT